MYFTSNKSTHHFARGADQHNIFFDRFILQHVISTDREFLNELQIISTLFRTYETFYRRFSA